MVREVLKECAHSAVEIASITEGVAAWGEWGAEHTEQEVAPKRKRSDREEKFLWSMLVSLDRESAKEEKKSYMRKVKKITQARKKMGAGKSQLSIVDQLAKARSSIMRSGQVQGDSVGEERAQGTTGEVGQHVQGANSVGEQHVHQVGSEGGQHVQEAGRVGEQRVQVVGCGGGQQVQVSMGEERDLSVDSVGEKHDIKLDSMYEQNDVKKKYSMGETDAKPDVELSVAELSPVCTVAQSEAIPIERSATTSDASQTDNSVAEKVSFGYKTKFKSFYSIDGISKGKFTLKKAKGGQSSSRISENISNKNADNKEEMKTGNRVDNIAHIFRGVKGRREILTTPTKRKPEGEVGGAVSSLMGIFENKLHSESISERTYGSPAKRQRGDCNYQGSVTTLIS